ncbi:MAG: carboxylic acid reductase [Frankiaceae bacterium]
MGVRRVAGNATRPDDRIAMLRANDRELAEAAPSPAVADAMSRAAGSLVGTIRAAMTGYRERPALAQRARRIVEDRATGRTSLELLPRCTAMTYGELWDRVGALTRSWADGVPGGFQVGDFVAVLGFTSIDYATIDLACMMLGAVSVPLPAGSGPQQLAPIMAETRPRILATDVASLDVAVAAVRSADCVDRLVVFDHDERVDDHRDAFEAAVRALHGRAGVVTLSADLERGLRLPIVDDRRADDPDRLAGLIYTSGSTGIPKGAMYPESMITMMWQSSRGGLTNAGTTGLPTIVLHYMPMSHVNGRAWLVAGLASGGVGYFAARSDMSTLLDDMSLARPTVLSLVPRICDMLRHRYEREMERLVRQGHPAGSAEAAARAEIRDRLLGGRVISALCGSAPLSAKMHDWMESILGTKVTDCYGSTETGRAVVVDQRVRRPPVIDYRLVDVPELGYFRTDKPYPRGELRLKSVGLIPGYYKQPELTARSFDDDGYYRTGDIVAELMPDRLVYVDRINNVVKLSQGEFVAISRLEALYAGSPCIKQIYVHGNSEQAFLLAVVVPDHDGIGSLATNDVRAAVIDSMHQIAAEAGLNAYEIPRDLLIEPEPFSVENGLLSAVGKPLRPALKERYGDRLERRYAEIAAGRVDLLNELRAGSGGRPTLEAVAAAAHVTLGNHAAESRPDARFTDLGGDSLSAHAFSTVLEQIFDIDVPVQVIIGPTATLASIVTHVDAARSSAATRPTFASVHGRASTCVRAADLSLDRFIERDALAGATTLPAVTGPSRTVLLTGANGYLGRFLCCEWLDRMARTGGTLICIARGSDDDAARQRIMAALDGGAATLDGRYRELADRHLVALAGDIAAPDLGLSAAAWASLADRVDEIVHAAALVNHVLPYSQLFAPNVVGTAELIRLALTVRRKRFRYISTAAVAMRPDGSFVDEAADIRQASPVRSLDETYANGYATSKWAGEVLLREAHDRYGLPVAVFRPDMILAHSQWAGQLNVPDRFTRLLLSVVATGLAPRSFYALDERGNRQRAHYSGLPVDFTAAAITALGARVTQGHATYHVVNAHDDGASLDQFVDWLVERGHPITRIDDYYEWRSRFEIALKGLPERQRKLSLLPLLHAFAEPARPIPASTVPAEAFHAAVREQGEQGEQREQGEQGARLDGRVPHITAALIGKYVADLQLLELVQRSS